MLRNEIVEIRQWVDPERFEEGLGLCEALPGPASSQMAIYLGWLRHGRIGGLVSGTCFLLPGMLIVLLLSELWRNGQALSQLHDRAADHPTGGGPRSSGPSPGN